MIHEWEENRAKWKKEEEKDTGEWRWRSRKWVAECEDEDIF